MRRQGVALILVLAAAMMVLLALSAVLLRGADHQIAGALVARERQARALVDDIEVDLKSFLQAQGATLSCPTTRPQVLPLLDWTVSASDAAEQPIGISIVVWDGLGGVPLHLAGRGGILSQAVADPWQQSLQLPADLAAPPRDELPRPDRLLTQLAIPPGLAESAARYPAIAVDAEPALLVALSAHSDGRVNWRTAPLPLIEAVARLHEQQVDLEALAAARDGSAEWPPLPRRDRRPGRSGAGDRARAWLVAGSDRWQACIRITIAEQRFAYHLVFAGNDEGMQTIQRHACDG